MDDITEEVALEEAAAAAFIMGETGSFGPFNFTGEADVTVAAALIRGETPVFSRLNFKEAALTTGEEESSVFGLEDILWPETTFAFALPLSAALPLVGLAQRGPTLLSLALFGLEAVDRTLLVLTCLLPTVEVDLDDVVALLTEDPALDQLDVREDELRNCRAQSPELVFAVFIVAIDPFINEVGSE